MTRKLNEEETLKLVQLYRLHDCLWDIRCEAYKNKQMRISALKQIREEMAIKGLTIDEIKSKIKIIRSTYYLELNKIEKSTRSGAGHVYVPRVKWFNELNSFIKTVAARRTTMNNTENTNDVPGSSSRNQVAPLSSTFTPPLRVKRSKLSQRAAFIKRLKNMHDDKPRTDEENDYDLFGKSVSSQLKKLSEEQAAMAQESIQSILTQCKLADIRAKKSNSFPFQNPLFTQSVQHVCAQFNPSSYPPSLKTSPPESCPSATTSSFSLGYQNDNNISPNPYHNDSLDESA